MRVGVLRHQLFRPSEPFIIDQSSSLKRAQPYFFGRVLSGTAPRGAQFRLFAEGTAKGLQYLLLGEGSQLGRACQELSIELIHSHFGVEGMCSSSAARALDIPSVTTLHGYDVTYSSRALLLSRSPSWWRYARDRSRFLRSAEALVCVSEYVRSRALRLGAKSSSCHVIPTGVNTKEISYSSLPDSLTIVHVGRLVEVKGTEFLIRAVAVLARMLPDVQLRIVGEGPRRAFLEQLVDALGIRRHVNFLGALPHGETLTEIRASRVLCLPSVRAASGATEGLGQVLLEAGAIGRPVVGTSSGGIPEVIKDGKNGFVVPERDVAALVDALLHVLTLNSEARSMSVSGRQIVESEFDLSACTAKLEALYARIC